MLNIGRNKSDVILIQIEDALFTLESKLGRHYRKVIYFGSTLSTNISKEIQFFGLACEDLDLRHYFSAFKHHTTVHMALIFFLQSYDVHFTPCLCVLRQTKREVFISEQDCGVLSPIGNGWMQKTNYFESLIQTFSVAFSCSRQQSKRHRWTLSCLSFTFPLSRAIDE